MDLLRARVGPQDETHMDVWRMRPSGGSPERLTEQQRRREFPGAARPAHAALRGARGGPVGTVAVGPRRGEQGHTPGERRASSNTRRCRPAATAGASSPPWPTPRASLWRVPLARSARRGSRRRALPGADRAGAGPTLRRDVLVLSVRPRDGRRALAGPGWTGVRGPEGRRRGACPSRPPCRRTAAAWPSSSDGRGNGTWRSCRRTARTHERWPAVDRTSTGTADWSPDGAGS